MQTYRVVTNCTVLVLKAYQSSDYKKSRLDYPPKLSTNTMILCRYLSDLRHFFTVYFNRNLKLFIFQVQAIAYSKYKIPHIPEIQPKQNLIHS
jgi:hypothetical protein